MKDVTEHFDRCRECVRELWNNYFRKTESYDPTGIDFDTFDQVRQLLFDALVVSRIEAGSDDEGGLPERFLVVPRPQDGIRILVRRPDDDGNAYWDAFDGRVSAHQVVLAFVDFFDWESVGFTDLRYYLVEVLDWPSMPNFVGRQALVDVTHAGVFIKSPLRQP